jgi:hypothetical protein
MTEKQETEQVSALSSRRLYQRTLPLFVMSAIAAVLIVQYFAPVGTVFDPARTNILAVVSTVTATVQLYALTTLLLWRARSVVRRQGGNKTTIFSSVIFFAWFIFLVGLWLFDHDPVKLSSGTTYLAIYGATVGILSTSASGIKFVHHIFWTFRLFASAATLESGILFVTWLLTYLREMSLGILIWPGFAPIGDWISLFPYTAASRSLLLATGVGACIIAARAIVFREPGLIDAEMV